MYFLIIFILFKKSYFRLKDCFIYFKYINYYSILNTFYIIIFNKKQSNFKSFLKLFLNNIKFKKITFLIKFLQIYFSVKIIETKIYKSYIFTMLIILI